MTDQNNTFYTLQHRRTHQSPWLKPQDPLEEVHNSKWCYSSWDHFGSQAEPWHGSGNDYRPKYKKSHDETHSVWSRTGHYGWWSLEYAIKGLRRVQKAQAEGKFDDYDGYRNHNRAIRYEFRLVKVTIIRKTEIISEQTINEVERLQWSTQATP